MPRRVVGVVFFGLMCLMCCANIFIRGGGGIVYNILYIEVTRYRMMMNDEVAGCFLAGMQY